MTLQTSLPSTTPTTTDVLILGAGIAGLAAGNVLQQAGRSVQLVDKGRGVGGRLSTRRFANGAWFDHGAQYFTTNSPEFTTVVQNWETEGVVRAWFEQLMWFDGDILLPEAPTNPQRKRYIPVGNGMNSLPKQLAKNLAIKTSTRIVRLNSIEATAKVSVGWDNEARGTELGRLHSVNNRNEYRSNEISTPNGAFAVASINNQWEAVDEQGNLFKAKALIITSPVPQTLELLENSHLSLSHQQAAQLSAVIYEPCLALMIALKPEAIPADVLNALAVGYKARDPESALAWVGANHTKPQPSFTPPAFTLHASPSFSRTYWEAPPETILPLLLDALPLPLKPLITAETIDTTQYHRWKYSLLSQSLEAMPTVALKGLPPCFLAGDAFGNYAKIETAYLSGIAAANGLLR